MVLWRKPFFLSYSQRLNVYDLKLLLYRRTEFGLLLCFKIIRGLCCLKFEDLFSWAEIQAVVLHSFTYRVVRTWNPLSQIIA